MKTKKITLIVAIAVIALALLACNAPLFISPGDTAGAESTAAAQTVEAQLTEMANDGQVDGNPTATNTPEPTNTPVPTNTPEPTNTPVPTATATATSVPIPCNAAQFIRDVTIADGSQMAPGTDFVKVWRLKNVGSCSWTKDYTVAFDGGDKLGGSTVNMPEKVSPGEVVDIVIQMSAPNTEGTYKGYWLLRDEDGDKFGLGGYSGKPFWVQIKVVDSGSSMSYDFAAAYCDATWKTDAGTIYCQGTSEASDTFVIFTSAFQMETGKVEDEPTLVLNIEKDERLRGIYPAYTVKDGDRFVSRIGCIYESEECRVLAVLRYRIKGTDTTGILGEWEEKYDNSTTLIDVDLSSLAGKEVIFTLDVSSKSPNDDNQMFWFVPGIRNP